jgi:hypothetical protein
MRGHLEADDGAVDERETNVKVDEDDSAYQDGEGEGGCDAGKDGQRHGDNEEKGHHKGVDGVYQRHLLSDWVLALVM